MKINRYTTERSGATTWGTYDNRMKRFAGSRMMTEADARAETAKMMTREFDRTMIRLISKIVLR